MSEKSIGIALKKVLVLFGTRVILILLWESIGIAREGYCLYV